VNEIRHIVFDLGRVVLHWEPEIPYHRLIPDQAERRRFLSEICNADWLRQTDLGTSWSDAERELIAQNPEDEELIRAFRRNWHEMTPDVVEGTPYIIETLIAEGRDVTALTNFADDTFEEAKERFPVLGRFRGVTVSARVGLAKPDQAIFRRHEYDFDIKPDATLFFDDMSDNIAAARQAGWNAERFTDAKTMRTDLIRYGIDLD
jgi:2-haloacid dehalogenase